MSIIDMQESDYIAIDSCYLSDSDKAKLKEVKAFDVDDGSYLLRFNRLITTYSLGVDSGRIAIYQAPSPMTIESSSGYCGEIFLPAGLPIELVDFVDRDELD